LTGEKYILINNKNIIIKQLTNIFKFIISFFVKIKPIANSIKEKWDNFMLNFPKLYTGNWSNKLIKLDNAI
jgi:hypothetical protein